MTRDVTAWAGRRATPEGAAHSRGLRPCSGIGPILLATMLPAWARLGPLSMESQVSASPHRRFSSRLFLPRPLTQRGGLAVSRLDGRGFRFDKTQGLAVFPEPIPRIPEASHVRYRTTHLRWARPDVCRGTLSPRFVRSLAATLARIAYWTFLRPLVSGSLGGVQALPAVAGRRLPPCPRFLLRTVFALWKPDSVSGAFLRFRRSLSCPTTRGNIRLNCRDT